NASTRCNRNVSGLKRTCSRQRTCWFRALDSLGAGGVLVKLKMNFKSARIALLAATAAAVAAPRAAHADRRAYGETYEAVIAPKGELDVEIWSTYARLGEIDGGPATRGVRE